MQDEGLSGNPSDQDLLNHELGKRENAALKQFCDSHFIELYPKDGLKVEVRVYRTSRDQNALFEGTTKRPADIRQIIELLSQAKKRIQG